MVAGYFIILVVIAMSSVVSSVPIAKLDEDAPTPTPGITWEEFCEECPDTIEFFLSNIGEEQAVFQQLCEGVMNSDVDSNPMVNVCTAGFLGEMFYVRKRLAGHSDEEICSWFGCVYTPAPTPEIA